MKKILMSLLMMGLILSFNQEVQAHCEVPCGIFDDQARIHEIHENITTIAKAMAQVKELSAADEKNYNQIVRWINTKEEHAKKIMYIVQQYFMAQRIKLVDPENEAAYAKYQKELELLHKIMVHAMKSKQSLDSSHVEMMHDLLEEFETSYINK